MKKYLLLSLVLLLLVTTVAARLYTTTEDLKVRADKRSRATVLGVVKNGAQIDVEEDNGTWGKVKYNNQEGYIKTKYLKVAATTAPVPIAEETVSSPSSQNIILLSVVAVLALAVAWKLWRNSRHPARSAKSKHSHKEKHSLQLFWYQCRHCKAVVKNGIHPSHSGCLKSKLHHWTELAEVGFDNYFCKHCLTTIKAKTEPVTAGCPGGHEHLWVLR